MGALSEVKRDEIARILRALRRKKRNQKGEIVVTSDELLRDDDLADMHNLMPDFRDTKVKTAIAWLERAGFLQRNQNLTEVFQGKPQVKSLEEAENVCDRLNLGQQPPGLVRFAWDGVDASGQRADSGHYRVSARVSAAPILKAPQRYSKQRFKASRSASLATV